MKKLLVPLLFALIVLLISGCEKKDDSNATVTESTVNTPSPTVEPTPTVSPVVTDNLYPAFVTVEGNKRYGYINQTGEFIIEPKYIAAAAFSDGVALVTDENESKYIDTAGKVIFTGTDDIYISSSFVNGAAVFSQQDDTSAKYGYIDTKGNILLEPIYDRADDFNEDGTAFVIVNGKYEKINKSGDILDSSNVNNRYSNILEYKGGYIIYEDPDTQTAGVVDYKGNVILTPLTDTDAYNNSILYLGNGLFGVGDTSKGYTNFAFRPYAIFNSKGEQVTDYIFYDLSPFHNGYASVTDDNYTYFINENGAPASDLPKVTGRGNLTLLGDIIKGDIDGEAIYMNKDGTILWSSDKDQILDNGLTIHSKSIKPNKFVSVKYPVIEGMQNSEVQDKINLALKKKFTDHRVNLTKEDELSVEDNFQSELLGNMLIIVQLGYDYYFGAAHGMPIKNYYHIDLSNGQIYSLKDLFLDHADYVSAMNKMISQRMKEEQQQENSMYFDDFSTIAKDQFFHLTKDGMVIYFYPYDIAPYAAGFPEFKISYQDLKDLIDYDGPVWKAMHK